MKLIGVLGASALRKVAFVETLIAALVFEGYSVSTVKRAPDGFDMDQPGKMSYARREAGCREVMLVGDRRLVLMQEFRERPEPALASLVARLEPVDVVIAEGFQGAAIPSIEVIVPGAGRAPRWPGNANIVALVCDEPLAASLPRFATDDIAGLAAFLVAHLALPPRA